MKTVTQIARELGLTKNAITKRLAKMDLVPTWIGQARTYSPSQVRKIVGFRKSKGMK